MKSIDQWYEPEKIIDAHVHLLNHQIDSSIDFWSKEMDRYEIEKMVLLLSTPNQFDKIGDHLDKFVPFLWTSPKATDVDTIEELHKDKGLKGLKIYPCLSGVHPAAEEMKPLYKYANKNRIPLTFHMGFSSAKIGAKMSLMNPELLIPVLERYDRSAFLFAHFAPGYFQEFIRLLYQFPNVVAETSSSNNWVDKMITPLTLEDVFKKALEVGSAGRIIFGTDSMDRSRGWRDGVYKTQLSILNKLGCSQEEIDRIFYKNIEMLIGK